MSANAQPVGVPASVPTTDAMPPGYNILFVPVDQEHFFPKWPFPVPAREAIKKKSVTFLDHQAASCVCSSARSVVHTGQHIQHTGIADNLNYVWQRDLQTSIKSVGHRLGVAMASFGACANAGARCARAAATTIRDRIFITQSSVRPCCRRFSHATIFTTSCCGGRFRRTGWLKSVSAGTRLSRCCDLNPYGFDMGNDV